MPVDDLMVLLQKTTEQLAAQHNEVAADKAAYSVKFWQVWVQLPNDFGGGSVAAANRECERHCQPLEEAQTLNQALLDGLSAKRDALIAILSARAK
jgi:hypothetical protein